jgi:hypothetical protein
MLWFLRQQAPPPSLSMLAYMFDMPTLSSGYLGALKL